MYDEGFSKRVEISEDALTEGQRIVVSGLIREGEFSYRAHLIEILKEEIALHEQSENSKDVDLSVDWVDGIRYCIQLVKEMDPLHD